MQTIDDNTQNNIEIKERIESIKNICYVTYTDSTAKIIICTAVCACFLILAPYFMVSFNEKSLQAISTISPKWLEIVVPATVSVAAIIISIGLWRIYSNRQYLVELENGKNVLVVCSFRRFRKFYFNNSCYIVKNGQVEKVKAKKRDNIKMLFSQMKRNMIIKKVSE
ncbi:MAG: hypothetical protein K2K24_00555, partial [Clostridia bacterium]|nr:hypothetical protein [Clostridia bacterium]